MKKTSKTVIKEGQDAFHNEVPNENNPYIKGDSFRALWFEGWYTEQIRKRLGHIFDKYGITWP